MNTSSKFVKIIRQKLIPIQKIASNSSTIEEVTKTTDLDSGNNSGKKIDLEAGKEKEKEREIVKSNKGGTKYIGISNTDMPQRVQHTIRNLMELDEEELAFIENMNCRNMFEIVKLLNQVVSTLVENMMAIDK